MTSAPRIRLFVAADVPRGHREAVVEWAARRRQESWGGRWLPASSQHVTLRFLGPTLAERLGDLTSAIAAAAAAHERATVSLGGVGGFPSMRRARVLWVGVEDPSRLLGRLAEELDRGLEPLGWVPERRPFTPHLTLARFPTPVRIDDSLDPGPPRLDPFEIGEAILYRSHLHPRGARYEPLASHPLR